MADIVFCVINSCIFGTVTDTKMKRLRNRKETHLVFLEMLDMISNSYTTNFKVISKCFSCTP
jgi:hypothetical protein